MANDETTLLELTGEVLESSEGEPVTWAVDLNAGGAALLIALLAAHGQKVLYIPGRTVHHASGSYRGDGKTDAKDAYVIADQARMRRDLHPLQEQDEIAVDLRILTARRYDLTADRTRVINRLRAQLLEYFPALERAFNYSTSKAELVLLTGYQTPAALRRTGRSRLSTWLANRKVRNAQAVAFTALEAAQAQHTVIPGERTAAAMVRTLAAAVMALDEEIARTDALIETRFREHAHAAAITSMPGMGSLLGAEFIACTGGNLDVIGSSGRLAGIAGLAPRPQGLRTHQRQHAPTASLPPPPPARLLPVCPGRRPVLSDIQSLLRTQEERGQVTQAGHPCPCLPPPRRLVGPHTRPADLHRRATSTRPRSG